MAGIFLTHHFNGRRVWAESVFGLKKYSMSKKGYFVHGEFVERGSETDEELKAEQVDSKTAMKRRMEALQALGADLVELKRAQIQKLPASERLIDALLMAKEMPRREERRRQMQYIGKLMRTEDDVALQQAWGVLTNATPQAQAYVQVVEGWRERLLADDAALQEWLGEYEDTDIQRLRSLIRQTRKDMQKQKKKQKAQAEQAAQDGGEGSGGATPQITAPKSGAYKQLFQLLKSHVQPGV